jgi:hypothetical protein
MTPMIDATPVDTLASDFLDELVDELDHGLGVPFMLAGGNPDWIPREPVLAVEEVHAPNRRGRPAATDLTGISILLPNGTTCIVVNKLGDGRRWECITDTGLQVFSASFLRELRRQQGR